MTLGLQGFGAFNPQLVNRVEDMAGRGEGAGLTGGIPKGSTILSEGTAKPDEISM
jgi:hypothetical protein